MGEHTECCRRSTGQLLFPERFDSFAHVSDQKVWRPETGYVHVVVGLNSTHTSLSFLVCGTTAVDVPGVENVDVTDLVTGHQDYCFVTGDILERVRHGNPFPCGIHSHITLEDD